MLLVGGHHLLLFEFLERAREAGDHAGEGGPIRGHGGRHRLQRRLRHAGHERVLRVLHEHRAAGPRPPPPRRPVGQRTRQDDRDAVGAEGRGGRAEEGVDRGPDAVLPRPGVELEPVAPDDEMTVRRRHIDMAGLRPHAVAAVRTQALVLRATIAASTLREVAGMCSTTQTAIGRSVGNAPTRRLRTSTPPAEVPMTATPRNPAGA